MFCLTCRSLLPDLCAALVANACWIECLQVCSSLQGGYSCSFTSYLEFLRLEVSCIFLPLTCIGVRAWTLYKRSAMQHWHLRVAIARAIAACSWSHGLTMYSFLYVGMYDKVPSQLCSRVLYSISAFCLLTHHCAISRYQRGVKQPYSLWHLTLLTAVGAQAEPGRFQRINACLILRDPAYSIKNLRRWFTAIFSFTM